MLTLRTLMTSAAAAGLGLTVLLMILFPKEGLDAAVRGVSIWWEVLFPALLPFFVIAELLLGLGIVHFFGTLLDPMMRPVFRIPGIGGFVMAMGFASGYPVGARLASQLREQQLISRTEGERLVSFATTADPIFLIGAVAVGFFHDPSLAIILACAHYGGAIVVGLVMRYHRPSAPPTELPVHSGGGPLFYRALRAMHHARLKDGREAGTLIRDALTSSLRLILVIGGLVVFFSVILEVLTSARIMSALYMVVNGILSASGIPMELSASIVSGLFEVTLGAKAAGSAAASIPLVHKTAIAVFVLSWGGLSVHAQIVSLLNHTDIGYKPFLFARLVHGLTAAAFVYVIWSPIQPLREQLGAYVPAFAGQPGIPFGLWAGAGVLLAGLTGIMSLIVLYLLHSGFKGVHELLEKTNNKPD